MPTYIVSNRTGAVGPPQPKDGDIVTEVTEAPSEGKIKLKWGKCHLKGIDMSSTEPQIVEGMKTNTTKRPVTLKVVKNGSGFEIKDADYDSQGGDELTGSWTATPPPPPYPSG